MSQSTQYMSPESFYHIYNTANAEEKLFYSEDNYKYFLQKYMEYIEPIADTYAYCLIPNHFHFLIKIRGEEELFDFLKSNKKLGEQSITREEFELMRTTNDVNLYSLHVSKQFSNFFNGYSQAINKQQQRRGGLFLKNFKRKNVNTDEYLKRIIIYINTNAQHHGLVKNFWEWKYVSYHSLLSELPTKIKRNEVLDLFENKENFKATHLQKQFSSLELE
jgi:putative transposase